MTPTLTEIITIISSELRINMKDLRTPGLNQLKSWEKAISKFIQEKMISKIDESPKIDIQTIIVQSNPKSQIEMNVIGYNARSINDLSNKYSLESLLIHNPETDLLFIVETWMKSNPLYLKNKNYKIFSHDGNGNRGVMMLLSTKFKAKPIYSKLSSDCLLCIEIMKRYSDEGLIAIVCYLPPSQEEKKIKFLGLIELLNQITKDYNKPQILLFGDINCDSKTPRDSLEAEIIISLADKIQIINRPEKNKFRLEVNPNIDIIGIHNITLKNIETIDKVGYSDHHPIKAKLLFQHSLTRNIRKLLNLKKLKLLANDSIIRTIITKNFNHINFEKKFKKIYVNPPISIMRKKSYFEEIKEIEELLQENKNYKNDVGVDLHRKMNEIIKSNSNLQYENFLYSIESSKISQELKEHFAKIGTVIFSKDKMTFIEELHINGKIKIDKEMELEIENKYLEKFSTKGDKTKLKELMTIPQNFRYEISKEDIKRALNKLAPEKAVSWDGISGQIKKMEEDDLLISNLSIILNQWIKDRKIPKPFNIGRLIALNKKPLLPAELKNIRPINVNSTLVKLFESIILDLMNKDSIENKLHISQNGFRKNKSTIYHIEDLINSWETTKFILFIDFSTAFDDVDHFILINKVQNICSNKNIIELIKIIYQEMYTKVYPRGKEIPINKGVLQGSLISPTLFSIYINNLLEQLAIGGINPFAFADDLATLCRSILELENTIKIIEKWTETNKMSINKDKSSIFVLHSRKNEINDERFSKETKKFLDYPIENSYKYLGITLDNKMKAKLHIIELSKWLNEFLKKITKTLTDKFSVKLRIDIFKIYIQSTLLYGFPIYIKSKKDYHDISILYYKGIRKLLKFKKFTQLEMICLCSNILTFDHLYLLKLKKYEISRKKTNPDYRLSKYMEKVLRMVELKTNILFADLPNIKLEDLLRKNNENFIKKILFGRENIIENCFIPFQYGKIIDQIVIEFIAALKPIIFERNYDGPIKRNQIAICNKCNIPATITHIINDCKRFTENRIRLEQSCINNITDGLFNRLRLQLINNKTKSKRNWRFNKISKELEIIINATPRVVENKTKK